jgi:hypothetical protein
LAKKLFWSRIEYKGKRSTPWDKIADDLVTQDLISDKTDSRDLRDILGRYYQTVIDDIAEQVNAAMSRSWHQTQPQ